MLGNNKAVRVSHFSTRMELKRLIRSLRSLRTTVTMTGHGRMEAAGYAESMRPS